MATCGLKDKCKKATDECGKLSHPFMNAKKSCYEATKSPTPLGQAELPGYKSHVKAVMAIAWRCEHCAVLNYGEDTLRRPQDSADLVKTDNILCEHCYNSNDIYMDL